MSRTLLLITDIFRDDNYINPDHIISIRPWGRGRNESEILLSTGNTIHCGLSAGMVASLLVKKQPRQLIGDTNDDTGTDSQG